MFRYVAAEFFIQRYQTQMLSVIPKQVSTSSYLNKLFLCVYLQLVSFTWNLCNVYMSIFETPFLTT